MRLRLKETKNSYISLFIFAVILVVLIFFSPSEFSGFAINDGAFNLNVEIPGAYSTIEPGSEIHFTTRILNLAGENRIDISLMYEIVDGDKKLVASKIETMAIETQASFVGSMKIPEEAKSGQYDLHVTLFVNDIEEASGMSSFNIINEENKTIYYTYIIIISIVSLALIIFIVKRFKVFLEKLKTRTKIHNMINKKLAK